MLKETKKANLENAIKAIEVVKEYISASGEKHRQGYCIALEYAVLLLEEMMEE